jgi:peptidoglycan-N-acetylglucosamine deacetylase
MINEIHTSKKVVAITFDDGPNPVYTPQVLEIFSKAKGKATFFMIGEQMRNHPEVVKTRDTKLEIILSPIQNYLS